MNLAVQKYPGATWNFSQPIEDNVGESMTGTKGSLALKVFGDDLTVLEQKGEEVTAVMAAIPGMNDVKLLRDFGQPNLDSQSTAPWRPASASRGRRPGCHPDRGWRQRGKPGVDRRAAVRRDRALPGAISRHPAGHRQHSPARALWRARFAGATLHGKVKDGAYDIYREGNGRYIAITFNVRDRDLGTTVEDAIKQINDKVKFAAWLPPGLVR